MKEIVVVILVIYFYNTSQHGLASANDKSIEKNGPSKTDITEKNERTFYMGHAQPGARNRKHCSKKNRFPLVPFSKACDSDRDWKIVGGFKAEEGQFPYQVYMRIVERNGDTEFCGGSILNEQWVLTAAHCMEGHVTSITVVAGTNSQLYGGYSYNVADSIVHSDFYWNNLRNDIALLKINGYIAFNARVQPIPLETRHVGAGVKLVVSGWGYTSYPGDLSDDLLFLKLKSISTKACNKPFAKLSKNVDDTQLCTFINHGQGTCRGDSGGPLAHNGKLVGIVSWGQPCAKGYPDVFTRVSSYIDWIKNTIRTSANYQ